MTTALSVDPNTVTYWENLLEKHLGIKPCLNATLTSKKPETNPVKLICVPAGITAQEIIAKWKDVDFVIQKNLNLDELLDTRTTEKAYDGWMLDLQEADPKFLDQPIRVSDPLANIGATLTEQLLSMIEYSNRNPGKYLDPTGVTLCSGSRLRDDNGCISICYNAVTQEIYIRKFGNNLAGPKIGIRQFFQ